MATLALVPEPEDEVLRLRKAIEMMQVDLDNANADLAAKRRIISTLRNQLEQHAQESEDAALVEPVIEYWRWKLDHPRARSSAKRILCVSARMKRDGHTIEEVFRAIDGCALKPYVGDRGRCSQGKRSERHDGLDLICKDEETFDRFTRYREASVMEDRLSVVLRVLCLPKGMKEMPFDEVDRVWRCMCPVCRVGWDKGALLLTINQHYVGCESCVGLDHVKVREALL